MSEADWPAIIAAIAAAIGALAAVAVPLAIQLLQARAAIARKDSALGAVVAVTEMHSAQLPPEQAKALKDAIRAESVAREAGDELHRAVKRETK